MNNTILPTLLLLLFAAATPLLGQERVELRLDTVVARSGEEACVPLIADQFPDINSMQWSVTWDADSLFFTEVRLGDNPLGLDNGSLAMPESDVFGVVLTTSDLSGITLEPGTTILEICFTTGFTSGSQPLNFDGFLVPEFAQEGSLDPFAFDTVPGYVRIGIPSAIVEPAWGAGISLYPNPVRQSSVTLDGPVPELTQLSLLDAQGRELRNFVPTERRLDLGSLPAGVYLLRLSNAEGSVYRRLVRQ